MNLQYKALRLGLRMVSCRLLTNCWRIPDGIVRDKHRPNPRSSSALAAIHASNRRARRPAFTSDKFALSDVTYCRLYCRASWGCAKRITGVSH